MPFVFKTIEHLFHSNEIPILSYIKRHDDIQIHSHPLEKRKEEWFDWVLVKWEYNNCDFDYVPARVMHIIDMTNINVKDQHPYKTGLYVCIISLKASLKKLHIQRSYRGTTYERNYITSFF